VLVPLRPHTGERRVGRRGDSNGARVHVELTLPAFDGAGVAASGVNAAIVGSSETSGRCAGPCRPAAIALD